MSQCGYIDTLGWVISANNFDWNSSDMEDWAQWTITMSIRGFHFKRDERSAFDHGFTSQCKVIKKGHISDGMNWLHFFKYHSLFGKEFREYWLNGSLQSHSGVKPELKPHFKSTSLYTCVAKFFSRNFDLWYV